MNVVAEAWIDVAVMVEVIYEVDVTGIEKSASDQCAGDPGITILVGDIPLNVDIPQAAAMFFDSDASHHRLRSILGLRMNLDDVGLPPAP